MMVVTLVGLLQRSRTGTKVVITPYKGTWATVIMEMGNLVIMANSSTVWTKNMRTILILVMTVIKVKVVQMNPDLTVYRATLAYMMDRFGDLYSNTIHVDSLEKITLVLLNIYIHTH